MVDLLEQHGILRLSDFRRRGVNPLTLSRLVDQGILRRPSRGLYELADAEIDMSHSLAEVAKRVPKGVICLISALQFHDITLQSPSHVWIAVGTRSRKPTIDYPPTRAVHFGEAAISLGVETHMIDSVPVKIFHPAKTIVDCFRFRNKVGLDVALEALRMGWRSRKASSDEITDYAQKLRAWNVIRPYLESVVADEG
ncbi:MAG: type IV toxin-antitoxin system AbiEi family antitoxin domain-containing protein [Geminicoccaceae bacterium]